MARIKPQQLLMQSKKKKGPSRTSIPAILIGALFALFLVLSLMGTYRHWHNRPKSQEGMGLANFERSDLTTQTKKPSVPKYAIIETGKGAITMELYKDATSDVVEKFLELCKKGHFKGMLFHHVIKNYVIQGGDSQGDPAPQDWILNGKNRAKVTTSPKHEAFMIGTTKLNPNRKGFDLFITTAPIPDLNEKLLIFGRVIKGEDVVQEIEEVDTDEHYKPKSPVGIVDISLKQDL
ncbi:Peptidyl-prolyl cis-trans isomerase [Rhynchospora pubera]|uniref:Peptidyl-prolyl cis-trans isomerase n=1 Tax=Rhynchospora pubera TaxID=906938 RepID=A0AAV8EK69_9POAL|nr:Peptidyl-prolyl cis-trans isomerase [Rhynchospora pubera]